MNVGNDVMIGADATLDKDMVDKVFAISSQSFPVQVCSLNAPDKLELNLNPQSLLEEETKIIQELAVEIMCINPFFDERILVEALSEFAKLSNLTVSFEYALMSDSFIEIIELGKTEEFKNLLKEVAPRVANKVKWPNENVFISRVVDQVTRACNKVKYDRLITKAVLEEMKR